MTIFSRVCLFFWTMDDEFHPLHFHALSVEVEDYEDFNWWNCWTAISKCYGGIIYCTTTNVTVDSEYDQGKFRDRWNSLKLLFGSLFCQFHKIMKASVLNDKTYNILLIGGGYYGKTTVFQTVTHMYPSDVIFSLNCFNASSLDNLVMIILYSIAYH